MVYGNYEPFFEKDADVLTCKREKDGEGMSVIGNSHETRQTVELPILVSDALFSSYEDFCVRGDRVTLRPHEALLFGMES